MAAPLFSIGGLVSGMDTTTIIRQLMELERQPIRNYQGRQNKLRAVDDAWGKVTGRLSTLRGTVDKLKVPNALSAQRSVTSSNTEAVTVRATGSPTIGALDLTVQRLATAHQLSTTGSFASASDKVGAGTFALNWSDGSPMVSVTTDAQTTLADLASQINAADAGVSASAVKVAEGDYRLVMTAKRSGAVNAFSLGQAPASLGTEAVLSAGVDAELKLGTLTVTRSSNTVTDLIDGVSIELKQTTAAAVNVSVASDTDAGVGLVKDMVAQLNSALSLMKELSAYDAEKKTSGVLSGDATVRKLVSDLRGAIVAPVAGLSGAYSTPGEAGFSIDRYGVVSVDETKLRDVLAKDPAAVERLLSRAGAATGGKGRFVNATGDTVQGAHSFEVTRQAAVAAVTGNAYVPPLNTPRTVTITAAGKDVAVTIDPADDVAAAIAKINNALRREGVTTLSASNDGNGALRLSDSTYGLSSTFTVAGSEDFGLDGTFNGLDAAGLIDGVSVIGKGTVLTANTGSAKGLAIDVAGLAAGTTDTMTYTDGLVGALDRVMARAEGSDGAIQRRRDTISKEITRYDDQIAVIEVRLVGREKRLRAQFTAMETALSNLQQQSSRLSSQLGSLQPAAR